MEHLVSLEAMHLIACYHNCISILSTRDPLSPFLAHAYLKIPNPQFPCHSKEHVATLKCRIRFTAKKNGQNLYSPTCIPPVIPRAFMLLVPEEQTFIQLEEKNVVADHNDMWYSLWERLRSYHLFRIFQALRDFRKTNPETTQDFIFYKLACPYADIVVTLTSSARSIVPFRDGAAPAPREFTASSAVIASFRIIQSRLTPVMFDDLWGVFDLGVGDIVSRYGFCGLNGAFKRGGVEMIDMHVCPFFSECVGLTFSKGSEEIRLIDVALRYIAPGLGN
jgi:hypothetical protein